MILPIIMIRVMYRMVIVNIFNENGSGAYDIVMEMIMMIVSNNNSVLNGASGSNNNEGDVSFYLWPISSAG